MKSISVIIPLYNEKDSIERLYQELKVLLDGLNTGAEILFVDDGSRDGSLELLKRLQKADSRIRIVRLRRNFGKSSALSAGFKRARGEVVVTLDADLQDDPAEIPKLLSLLEEGNDLVSGWKVKRQDSLLKRISSRLFNVLTAWLTGVPLHDINCGLKVYRRRVIEEIEVYGEMHRFIPVLASYRGFRVAEAPVNHRRRVYGKSKYGVNRVPGGLFDLLTVIMLTRYNSKPLHAFGFLGIGLFLIGVAIEVYLSIGWFLGRWISDRPLFMLGILLLTVGIHFIFFGLLAEMVAYSSRSRDEYSVEAEFASSEELTVASGGSGRK